MDKNEAYLKVLDLVKRENFIDPFDHPKQGQFVITGRIEGKEKNFDNTIGYCVQVRLNRGDFGSDQVFLRHCDGKLVHHENQCFYAMSQEQIDIVKPFFKPSMTEDLEKVIAKLMVQLNTVNHVAGYLADCLFSLLECNATELALDINAYRKQLAKGCESDFGMQALDAYKKYVDSTPRAKPAVYIFLIITIPKPLAAVYLNSMAI
ncbi:hypothetical protein [Spartinivicinus poritis]|uniref:Uncharacterized protein n=1 Tax=Spartinivicinus poritis TaxID=2994640 RepID=A0ABT5UKU6_9GAMM|nr:hypothetical protein [Spartinivicinus sp. A2-2]MDE1465659.1 hypothetical protein [Spartinivicinus sp. A2-2]